MNGWTSFAVFTRAMVLRSSGFLPNPFSVSGRVNAARNSCLSFGSSIRSCGRFGPATLDTTQAVLTTRTHETLNGVISHGSTIPSDQWAFAHCDGTTTNKFPGTPQDLECGH